MYAKFSILCVCGVVCPYQLLNQVVDFYEIHYEGHTIVDDLDTIVFNAITATIPK
jgi:hypothetical protein